jgi:hypothetical protein
MATHKIRVQFPGDMGNSRLSGKVYHLDMSMPKSYKTRLAHIGTKGGKKKLTANTLFKARNVSPEEQARNLIGFRMLNKLPITGSKKEAGRLAPEAQMLYSKVVSQAARQGVQFPQNQKERTGLIHRALDVLSRANYASANIAQEYKKGNFNVEDVWKAGWAGLTGKKKGSYDEVFHNKFLGLLGDVFLDPTTYVGVGLIGDVGKGVKSGIKIAEGMQDVNKTAQAAGATTDIADAVSRIGVHPSNRRQIMDIFKQVEDEAEASRLLTHVQPKVSAHRAKVNDWTKQVLNPKILKYRGEHLGSLADIGDDLKKVLGSRVEYISSSDIAHKLVNERRLVKTGDGQLFRKYTSGMPKAKKDAVRKILEDAETLNPKMIDDLLGTAGNVDVLDDIPDASEILGLKTKQELSGGKAFGDNPELFDALQASGRSDLADEAGSLFDDAMRGPEGNIITEGLTALEKLQPDRAIGLRFGKAGVPIAKLPKNASIWHAAEKLKAMPGAPGNAVAGLERYFRSLRSAHPGLGDVYSAQHANVSEMNNQAFNRLKGYWEKNKVTRHQDKEMIDYFNNPIVAPDEIHSAITHEISMMARAVMEGTSQAEDTKGYWKEVARKLNPHLPEKQKIDLKKFDEGSVGKLKSKDPFTQADFNKIIANSELVGNGRYLSNVVAAMHIATNSYTHGGALVEGAKAFGSSNKNLRAKGWRELNSNDFAGSGKWQEYIDKFKDEKGDRLLFHPDDRKGVAQMYDYVERPVQNHKVFEDISRIQRGWKALVTSYNFPSYYTRNSVGDIMMNSMNGLHDPRFYRDAFKIMAYARDLKRNKQFLAHMTPGNKYTDVMRTWAGGSKNVPMTKIGKHNITILDYIREYVSRGLGATQTEEELLRKSGVGASGVGAISGKGGKLHQTVLNLSNNRDNIFRIANFQFSVERALKKGATLEDAFAVGADAVRRTNFDFSDFSPLELKSARVFPFYRYLRRSVPNTMRLLAAHPMRYKHWYDAQEAMDTGMEDPVTPWYLRSQPFATIGQRTGDTAYFRFPNPITETLAMAETPGAQGFNQETRNALLDALMSKITPVASIPYQLARGETLTGRPYTEKDVASSFGLLGKLIEGGSINKSMAYENAKRDYANFPDTGMAGNIPQWLLPLLLQDVQYNTGKKQKGELARVLRQIQAQADINRTKPSKEDIYSDMFPWQ